MQKSFAYKILVSQKTIIAYYHGNINIDDLINFKIQIGENKEYDPKYNLLLDFRNCKLNFGEEGVKKYIKFLRHNKKLKSERLTVFLTERANEVLLTTLFEILKGKLPVNTMIFSTLEAAVENLFSSSENFVLIEDTVEKLKNSLN